jgi:hypothetical protein
MNGSRRYCLVLGAVIACLTHTVPAAGASGQGAEGNQVNEPSIRDGDSCVFQLQVRFVVHMIFGSDFLPICGICGSRENKFSDNK